jgi:hypothetical protein
VLLQSLTYRRNCFVANSSSALRLVLAGVEPRLEALEDDPERCASSNTRPSMSKDSEAGWEAETTSFEVILSV